MKPNLAQLLNCTHVPYRCQLVETQFCVDNPARHDCHMEMQAKLIFYSKRQFKWTDSKQCWISCSYFRQPILAFSDNQKWTPDTQHSADLCGMLATRNMCSSPEKRKDRS